MRLEVQFGLCVFLRSKVKRKRLAIHIQPDLDPDAANRFLGGVGKALDI
jgi:hypothetical protein